VKVAGLANMGNRRSHSNTIHDNRGTTVLSSKGVPCVSYYNVDTIKVNLWCE
jgi:hypothetical protein